MKHLLVSALVAAALVVSTSSASAAGVMINREPVADDVVELLEYVYGTTIEDGAYWYDPYSGLWGYEGGPASGQIAAGLNLGGPLRSDASNGQSGVFFNGRQLQTQEVDYLQRRFGSAQASTAPSTNSAGAIDRGTFGTYGSDGSCFYVSVEGGDVLGPGC